MENIMVSMLIRWTTIWVGTEYRQFPSRRTGRISPMTSSTAAFRSREAAGFTPNCVSPTLSQSSSRSSIWEIK